MSKYRIRKLYIDNFKLIDRMERPIDWGNTDLIVLDGPNGFGKTTIFDAMELSISGQIYRIQSEDRRLTFNEDLLRKDPSRPGIIKIEFVSDNNESFILMKRIPIGRARQKYKADDFTRIETYCLNNFADMDGTEISQEQIEQKFGTEGLNRFFKLFYYIQQEENTRFLKQNSKTRLNELGHLFDTKREEEEKEKLVKLKQLLSREQTNVEQEVTRWKQFLQQQQTELESLNVTEKTTSFQELLPDLLNKKMWDMEHPPIENKEVLYMVLDELNQLEDFLNHFPDFLQARHNDFINRAVNNTELIMDLIIAANHLNFFEEIKRLSEVENRLVNVQKQLKREVFLKNRSWKTLNISAIARDLGKSINEKEIEDAFEQIDNLYNQAGDVSRIVQELNETRESLTRHFVSVVDKHEHLSNHECPLCGTDWKSIELLKVEIEKRREIFKHYYDESTSRLEHAIEVLFKKYLNSLAEETNNYLLENSVPGDFYHQLKQAVQRKDRVHKFIQWCETNRIQIDFVLNAERKIPPNLSERILKLQLLLQSHLYKIRDGYTESDEKFSRFQFLYKELFSEQKNKVNSLTAIQVADKKQYLENKFYFSRAESIKSGNGHLESLDLNNKRISEQISRVNEAIKIYESCIKRHWNLIMKDIEIPFFIYSGKIIQYYQRGLGVFIKENDDGEAKNVRFVSNDVQDYDATYHFSSGQLSSLVIAFTLALNKVYGKSELGMIFIDDPVQTMDEVNMAALTELLRNDFGDKQIILSTHEDEISRYIRYKFHKYGKETVSFHVRKDLHALMELY